MQILNFSNSIYKEQKLICFKLFFAFSFFNVIYLFFKFKLLSGGGISKYYILEDEIFWEENIVTYIIGF